MRAVSSIDGARHTDKLKRRTARCPQRWKQQCQFEITDDNSTVGREKAATMFPPTFEFIECVDLFNVLNAELHGVPRLSDRNYLYLLGLRRRMLISRARR
jgi:hypothetical protein